MYYIFMRKEDIHKQLSDIMKPILKRMELNDMYMGILTYREVEELKRLSFELINAYKNEPITNSIKNMINLAYGLISRLEKGV